VHPSRTQTLRTLASLAAVVVTLPLAAFAHEGHDDAEDGIENREQASRPVEWEDKSAPASRRIAVKILGINDFHGQLSAGKLVSKRPVGSAGVLAAYLRTATSAAAPDHTLVVHAGDHVGASPASSALLQDEPAVSFLNLLANRHCRHLEVEERGGVGGREEEDDRFEGWMDPRCNLAGSVGNHEFDEGNAELQRLLGGGNHAKGPFLENPWKGARYPTLAANVVDAKTGKPVLPPYVVKRVDGVPLAFIGVVLKETPTIVTPSGVAGLRFLDEADTVNSYVPELRRRGVRAIVVLIHQGGSQKSYTGATDPAGVVSGAIVDIVKRLDDEVDLVVSGHSHTFVNAILQNEHGKPMLVTQAYSAGTAYADIDLEIDRETRDVVKKSASIVTTWADAGPGLVPDPDAAALTLAAETQVAPLVNQVIGTATTAMAGAGGPSGESPLGDLIADAQRAAVPGADFAFMNPGGVRADLAAGPVTWGNLFAIQPFGNSLVALTLTGTQVRQLLEQQWQGQPYARILHASGIAYTWDAALPAGSRVVEIRKGGALLDPTASYRVVVNNFMAAGGDNFTVLVQGGNPVGGAQDIDALIAWVKSLPQPFGAPASGRITRLN
jgi:5'-nucleotidase